MGEEVEAWGYGQGINEEDRITLPPSRTVERVLRRRTTVDKKPTGVTVGLLPRETRS